MKRSGFRRKTYAEALLARSQKPHKARGKAKAKKTTRSKPKKLTTSKLKKQLDAIFSTYVRNKFAKEGYVNCYTCGKKLEIKTAQCGHFVSRQYLATRFDENNCRPQCVGCNVFGGGRTAIFATNLEKDGIDTKTLYQNAQKITKDYPYQEMIDLYTQKLADLSTQ